MSGLPQLQLIPGWSCYDWRNARTILQHANPDEWQDVIDVLSGFRLLHSHLIARGKGNKSAIAAAIDSQFYKRGWIEHKFETSVVVDQAKADSPTHAVDCFKGKIALELEWNNKDPFFDRDLNNFRLLYDLRVADIGIMVTRSTNLQKWLKARHREFGKRPETYGVSTTHFDKLEPRVLGGGAGGCPVLIFAMEPDLYLDDRPVI